MALKEKILVVDDEPSIRKYLQTLLEVDGFAVETVSSGKEAIAKVSAGERPDFIILDVLMPDMNGLEVQTCLRRDSPETRIIFITGREDPSIRQAALDAGAFGFLAKPFEDEVLVQLVTKALLPR